jgi:hypothetical protein
MADGSSVIGSHAAVVDELSPFVSSLLEPSLLELGSVVPVDSVDTVVSALVSDDSETDAELELGSVTVASASVASSLDSLVLSSPLVVGAVAVPSSPESLGSKQAVAVINNAKPSRRMRAD